MTKIHRSIIVGIAESGKSTLFAKLSEHIDDDFFSTSKTVEKSSEKVSFYNKNNEHEVLELTDTPGINTLYSSDKTASVTYRELASGDYDSLVFVTDLQRLQRGIALFIQLSMLRIPSVFIVNMFDESEKTGFSADLDKLRDILKVPVLPVSALTGFNVSRVLPLVFKSEIPELNLTLPNIYKYEIDALLSKYSISHEFYGPVLLKLSRCPADNSEVDIPQEEIKEMASHFDDMNRFKRMDLFITDLAFQESYSIFEDITEPVMSSLSVLEKIGIWAQKPMTGIPIMILVLGAMYVFVGMFGATYLVDNINSKIFNAYLIPWSSSFFALFHNQFVYDVFMDPDFGIIPTGLFLALGIVLPVLLTYYFFVGLLEDAGYFSRLSVLLDKSMRPLGLNGKGILPLLMGFSCITMAIMTTRILDTRKERIIATFLLILGLPCAPLMSTMFIILGRLPWSASLIVFGLIIMQIILGGLLANFILKGKKSDFIIDIPPLRIPKLSLVLYSTYRKTLIFLKEAIPIFMAASFLFFIAARMGFLLWLEDVSKPLVTNFWGLPKEAVQVLIKTVIRRENGVAELARLQELFSRRQMVITLLLMTFLVPCINSIIMIIKERGAKTGALLILSVLFYATIIGGLINHMFILFNITFA